MTIIVSNYCLLTLKNDSNLQWDIAICVYLASESAGSTNQDWTGFISGVPWVGKISCRRKWQPASGFLPGEFHGQRSLAGCSPWGHKESDTTEQVTLSLFIFTRLQSTGGWARALLIFARLSSRSGRLLG